MDRASIIETLADNLDVFGKAALHILNDQELLVGKEQIGILINDSWTERMKRKQTEGEIDPNANLDSPPVNSRYTLDIGIARLEGAGLITLHQHGRAKQYKISPLGSIVYEHIKRSDR